ncbi:hypothetical protein AGDE_13576 [Angomonas deanei]|nr:hypothetical protein AGDE_13576 [Angomonas deanei]|eukprot:EPY22150.1 hypothetical protein AGDE_13576 [Angomonas deanei]
MTEGASPNTPMADDAPPHYEHIKEIKSILASSTAKDTSPPTSTANRQVSLRSPTCTRTKETDSPHMEGSNYNLFTSSTHGRERKISFKKSGPYTTAPNGDGFDFPFDFHMPSTMANDGSTLQQRRLSYPQPMVSDRSKSQSVNSQMESEEYNTYMIEEIMAKYEADYSHSAVSRGSSQTHIDPGSDFSSVASGFNLSLPPETKTQHQRAEDDDRSDLQELCDEYDLDLDVDEYDLQAYAGTATDVEPSLRRGVSLLESACLRRNYYSLAISVNVPPETLQKEETSPRKGVPSNYLYSMFNRFQPVKEESNIKTIRPNVESFSPTSEAKKMENKTCITSRPKRKEASDKKSPPAQVPPPGFTSVTAKKK